MGRRPISSTSRPLTAETITDAALTLVDREGVDALSMRRLGAELGVEAMALYHHFPSKEALIDAVMARGTPGALPKPSGRWRDDLRALMNAVRRQLSAHPGLLPLRWARRRVSPEAKVILDMEAAIFERAGFGDDLRRDAHRLLGSYVVGFVVAGVEALREVSDAEWATQFDVGLAMLIDGIEARHRAERRLQGPTRPRQASARVAKRRT
jgi:AcrR family transcriptional regulator